MIGGMDGIIEFSLTILSALSQTNAAQCRPNGIRKAEKFEQNKQICIAIDRNKECVDIMRGRILR